MQTGGVFESPVCLVLRDKEEFLQLAFPGQEASKDDLDERSLDID